MIKECKVISWNECVMVIDFDGLLVQMPSTDKKENVIYVKYDKNYILSTKEEYKKSLIKHEKKEINDDND